MILDALVCSQWLGRHDHPLCLLRKTSFLKKYITVKSQTENATTDKTSNTVKCSTIYLVFISQNRILLLHWQDLEDQTSHVLYVCNILASVDICMHI